MAPGTDEADSHAPWEGSEDDVGTCAVCGESVETAEWHPIDLDVDDEVRLYAFCSQACRAAWEPD